MNVKKLEYGNFAVKITAVLVAVAGMINLFSAASPTFVERFRIIHSLIPISIIQGARVVSALAGFFLFLLGINLWRHKQIARLVAMLVLAISAVAHLLKGLDFEEATYMALLFVILYFLRPFFYAKSDRPSLVNGIIILGVAALFTLLYGTAGFYFLTRHLAIYLDIAQSLKQTVIVIWQFPDPHLFEKTRRLIFFVRSIYIIEFVTLGYALYQIFLPVIFYLSPSAPERRRALKITKSYGESVLARFALFNDKVYFFYKNSMIAYAKHGRSAIALGDPIGPSTESEGIIEQYKLFCQANDWRPVFYQSDERNLARYKEAGFSVIQIGNEAVVDLKNFSLEGSENKKIRNAYNKIAGLGYTVNLLTKPVTDRMIEKLRAISDDWLDRKNGKEEGFSLGWFDPQYLKDSTIAVLYSPNHTPIAFVNLIDYEKSKTAIDLMRHLELEENGLMEFFFVEIFIAIRKSGYLACDLGLSPLSMIGSKNDPIETALRIIYRNLGFLHDFKGLYRFKNKFHPDWQPRYLVYLKNSNLAAIMWSLIFLHR